MNSMDLFFVVELEGFVFFSGGTKMKTIVVS